MIMMDSATGKVITSVPIGERVDGNAYDTATGLAFSSNGEGNVTIAREETPDKLVVVQTIETAKSARTMALDSQTRRIYLAAADFEAAPAPTATQPYQRPNIVPGSFRILVYGPGESSNRQDPGRQTARSLTGGSSSAVPGVNPPTEIALREMCWCCVLSDRGESHRSGWNRRKVGSRSLARW
ncbi:MAG: hypothetical protein AB1714_21070 [Acidobacteriota bacterium]